MTPLLAVFTPKKLDEKKYLKEMKREGYHLHETYFFERKNVRSFIHTKGNLIVKAYLGAKGNPSLPRRFQYKTAIFLSSNNPDAKEKVLRRADEMARKHHGTVYGVRTGWIVTTYPETKWDPLAMFPSGRIAITSKEKKKMFLKWNIKGIKKAYEPCIGAKGLYFTESGHVVTIPEIFGSSGYAVFRGDER